MKNIFWTVLVMAVLLGLALVINNYQKEESPEVVKPEQGDVIVEGKVIGIDSEQIAFDGPYLIYVETGEGEKTVALPSMGLPMCPSFAAGNIADLNSIAEGVQIGVRGMLSSEGTIVPCESADHYLKIIE